eukprot:6811515-Prymnesium_polylepis.1
MSGCVGVAHARRARAAASEKRAERAPFLPKALFPKNFRKLSSGLNGDAARPASSRRTLNAHRAAATLPVPG